MASRVTTEGRRDRRFKAQAIGFKQQVYQQGATAPVKEGLGEMPLTLWILVAAVILYLYIRRASLGIDLHPGEGAVAPMHAPQPRVFIKPPAPKPAPWNGPGMGQWHPEDSVNELSKRIGGAL